MKAILDRNASVDEVYYAIGDIHGELSKLEELHDRISHFHDKHYAGHRHIRVHLGDYVDRGPQSYGVIEFIKSLSNCDEFQTINLRGNHEVLMANAQERQTQSAKKHWLVNGGAETIESYNHPKGQSAIEAHIAWFSNCPTIHRVPERGLIFVHAGIDPESYPDCDASTHMWTRSAPFFHSETWTNPALQNKLVIHGHTPTLTDYPDISKDGRRINIDTGACYGGPLSAVALAPNEPPQFIFHDQAFGAL